MSFFDHPVSAKTEAPKSKAETLDPAEIRTIHYDHSKPFYGLTKDQLRVIGEDPEQLEAGRVWGIEDDAKKEAARNKQLVDAARAAVADGELMFAQAVEILEQGGHREARAEFINVSLAEANAEALAEEQVDLAFLSPQEYVAYEAQKVAEERGRLGSELEQQFDSQIDALVPAGDPLRGSVKQTLFQKLEAGGIPTDRAEQERLVAASVESVVTDTAQLKSFQNQAEDQWRLSASLRKNLPVTEYAREKERFIQERMAALAQPATPGAKSGVSAKADTSGGEPSFRNARRMSDPYHEALAHAEREAGIVRDDSGTESVLPTPVERQAVAVGTRHAKSSRPDLPDDFADEYGPSHL